MKFTILLGLHLRGIHVKMCLFLVFSLALVSNYAFIIRTYVTVIAASRTATDDVTNKVKRRIFNTNP